LAEEGFETLFVFDVQAFRAAVARPECFLAFIEPRAFPDILEAVSRMSEATRSFVWAAVASTSNQRQSSLLYQVGAADIVRPPVHPVSFRSRARMLLARFLRVRRFTVRVQMPAGMHETMTDAPAAAPLPLPGRLPKEVRLSAQRKAVFRWALDAFRVNSGGFAIVDTAETQAPLMAYAAAAASKCVLWTPGRAVVLKGRVRHFDRGTRRVIVEGDDAKVTLVGPVFCNLRLGPGNIFFSTEARGTSEQLELPLPASIYQFQRRSSLRGQWAPKSRIFVEIEAGGHSLTAMLIDFSSQGLGLEIEDEEAEFLHLKGRLQARWRLDSGVWEAQGELCWRRPQGKGARLGVSLKAFRKGDPELLDLLALESVERFLAAAAPFQPPA